MSKQRKLRSRKAAEPQTWRKRRKNEELPPLTTACQTIPGHLRCRAIGLERGDCQMQRTHDSFYCYYHTALSEGLMEPDAPIYPVWPLPPKGYVLLEPEELAA